jgi:hypothetical protein
LQSCLTSIGLDLLSHSHILPSSLGLSLHFRPCIESGKQVSYSVSEKVCRFANFNVAKSATLAPWFPPHMQRNIYLSLLHLEPEEGKEKAPAVPDSVLRAALLRRAVEDIHRIIQVRSAKQACSTLLQRGSVGDDLWQRFLRAEKEMEEELRDVVMEVR